MSDKRRFHRVRFNAIATVHSPLGSIELVVADLSLRGVKLEAKNTTIQFDDSDLSMEIPLNGQATVIELKCRCVYQRPGEWGFEVTSIDLDSHNHLCRLLTMNLGDSKLIERDIHALMDSIRAA